MSKLDDPIKAIVELEVLVDCAMEHFAHGINDAVKKGLLKPSPFTPIPTEPYEVGTWQYHFAAAHGNVHRAYDIAVQWMPTPSLTEEPQ